MIFFVIYAVLPMSRLWYILRIRYSGKQDALEERMKESFRFRVLVGWAVANGGADRCGVVRMRRGTDGAWRTGEEILVTDSEVVLEGTERRAA